LLGFNIAIWNKSHIMKDTEISHTPQTGPETDIVRHRNFETFEQAEQLYLSALQRLVNVNGWNALTGAASDQYQLLNLSARPKTAFAEEGDFVRVKLADAKPDDDDEVLRIDRVITKLLGHNRSVSLVTKAVRIKRFPDSIQYVTGSNTTYTFVLQLDNNIVSAGIYVKDESAEQDNSGLYDKLTHALKELFAWTPPFKTQWHALIEALLK
jgi:hypothetical protein